MTHRNDRYDQDPQDPHNRRLLAAVQGVQNEHYAAFEQVLPNGSLNLARTPNPLPCQHLFLFFSTRGPWWGVLSRCHSIPPRRVFTVSPSASPLSCHYDSSV